MINPIEDAKQALEQKHTAIQETRYFAECDKADDLDIAFALALDYIRLLEYKMEYLEHEVKIWRDESRPKIYTDFHIDI